MNRIAIESKKISHSPLSADSRGGGSRRLSGIVKAGKLRGVEDRTRLAGLITRSSLVTTLSEQYFDYEGGEVE